ncbi:hypothetical protein [Mesorhizobium sp. AR02]|uniref:hypothetical protein n=1 Tax=Mesorhizobium sp. AR02 TaxID=2865837 RepID=UPI00215FEF79|nr:hypothetical protein [Mesorhizobium sp. AR02]
MQISRVVRLLRCDTEKDEPSPVTRQTACRLLSLTHGPASMIDSADHRMNTLPGLKSAARAAIKLARASRNRLGRPRLRENGMVRVAMPGASASRAASIAGLESQPAMASPLSAGDHTSTA